MSQLFTQILIFVPLFSPAPTVSGSSLVLSITSTSPHPIPAPNLHANATWVIRIQQVEETTGLASADIWPKNAGIYEQYLPKDRNKKKSISFLDRNLHVKITTCFFFRTSWVCWKSPYTFVADLLGVDADGGEVASIGWVLQPGQTRQRVRAKTWMAFRKWGNYGKLWETMGNNGKIWIWKRNKRGIWCQIRREFDHPT